MTRRWLQSVFIVLVFAGALHAQKRISRQTLLETIKDTPGWQLSGANYDSSSAQGFVPDPKLDIYGFNGLAVQAWQSPLGEVRATLFEMVDSPAAYGFFTLQRDKKAESTPTLVGADSFRTGGRLYFWQSNYVVKVEGPSQNQDALARRLSENILGASRKPPVAEHLPPGQLLPGTEKYLLNAEDIDTTTGIEAGQFGFNDSAEAATATYSGNGKTAHLLLLLYPTWHIAKKYADEIDSSSATPPAFRKRVGPLLAVVYGSKDEELAQSILGGVNHEFKVTWDEGYPGLALGTMIVTIFTFIGVALLFTLVAGIGFGGLRVFVKTRYPNRIFDRPEDMEVIQLKLLQGFTRKELGE